MAYPLQTAFETYLREQSLQKTTIKNYATTLNQFFTFLENYRGRGGVDILDQITETDLRAFFNHQSLSQGTFNKKLSHLNQYFLFLVDHGAIHHFPTLPLHGKAVTQDKPVDDSWLHYYPALLKNPSLHMYTRLTLLLLANGFTISEMMATGFFETFQTLSLTTGIENDFRNQFLQWQAPLQKLQGRQELFLKQRINRMDPQLSLPALHKYLHVDQTNLPFDLSPQKLHQAFVLHELKHHPEWRPQEIATHLRLTPASLLYYQALLNHQSPNEHHPK